MEKREQLYSLFKEMQEEVATTGKLSDAWEDKLEELVCFHGKLDVYLIEKDGEGSSMLLGTYEPHELEELEFKSKFYKEPFVISIERHVESLY
jgi:hypothetical protein